MARVAETMKEELEALKSGGKYMFCEGAQITPVVSLRDQFAMAALQGMLADPKDFDYHSYLDWAGAAYGFADAMLEAREQ